MEKQEFKNKMMDVMRFVEALPEDFMKHTISMPGPTSNYFHLAYEYFVDLFPAFEAIDYSGRSVELRTEFGGKEVMCLFPLVEYVKRFGHESLPENK